MCKWLDKTTALVLCSALVLVACGDDDEAAPVEPEPTAAEITPEIIALYGPLVSSFTNIFFQTLVPGTTSVEGAGGGSVAIAGNEWTMQDYAPDAEGTLIINGTLNVGIDQTPIPLTGTVKISGAQEAEVVLDIAISIGADGGLSATGKVTVDGAEFDAAELSAAVEAAAAG